MVRANAPAVRMRLRFVHRHQAIDQLPYNLHDTYERSLAARFALEPHLFYVACLHRIQVLQTHQEASGPFTNCLPVVQDGPGPSQVTSHRRPPCGLHGRIRVPHFIILRTNVLDEFLLQFQAAWCAAVGMCFFRLPRGPSAGAPLDTGNILEDQLLRLHWDWEPVRHG